MGYSTYQEKVVYYEKSRLLWKKWSNSSKAMTYHLTFYDKFGDIWGRGSVFKKSVVVLQTFVKLMGLVISDYVRNRWSTQMSTPKPPPPAPPPNTRFLRNPPNPHYEVFPNTPCPQRVLGASPRPQPKAG